MVKMQLNPAKMSLITGFFESYLNLSPDEELLLEGELEELPKKEGHEIMEMISSWERKGIEKGIQRGRQKGFSEGERKKAIEVASRLLEKGFEIEEINEITGLDEKLIKGLRN